MALSAEMRQLTQHLLESFADRKSVVQEIFTETAQDLAGFHAARSAMAQEQQRDLSEHVVATQREVQEMSRSTAAFLKEADQSHAAMSAEQKQQLNESVAATQREVEEMSRAAAAFLKEANQSHAAMSAEQKQQLSESVVATQREVEEMSRAAAAFLKEADQAHMSMAAEQRQDLAEYMSGLRHRVIEMAADTASMRDVLRAERNVLQADQEEARRAWHGFTQVMQQRRSRKGSVVQDVVPASHPVVMPSAPPPPVITPAATMPAATMPAVPGDDLTRIRGIGSDMQRRLNAAGIRSYAQLAESATQELRAALGDVGRLANVTQWIVQAKELGGIEPAPDGASEG